MNLSVAVQSALLLTVSNVFMTFAWYAHLKNLNDRPWWIAAGILHGQEYDHAPRPCPD